MKKQILIFFVAIFCTLNLIAQPKNEEPSLLDELGAVEPETDYTIASFKTTRIINGHSLENKPKGDLDFKILHRFGRLNGGLYELFGLDNAQMRFGFEYGLTDQIMIGVGRSTYEKTYDAFAKYKFLRQSTGKRNMPITAVLVANASINTLKWADPDRKNYFTSRLNYCFQLLIGRKFNNNLTLQLSPTLVHRNIVATKAEKNDVLALGIGGRYKLNQRLSLNAEYFYVLPNQIADNYKNSLSLGIDLETGGHVFQLHFTNSTPMTEKGFIAETTGDWLKGDIHFGFNIARVFTIGKHH